MLIRNTIIYVLLDVLSKASALIILPLVTKNLSVIDYGIYRVINEFSMLVIMFSTFGIGSAIVRYNFDRLNIKRIYSLGYFTSIMSNFISIIFLVFLNFKYDLDFIVNTVFLLFTFLNIFNSYARIYFTVNQKLKEFSIIKSFELCIFFVSVVSLDYFMYLNIHTLLISMLLMSLINTLLSFMYAKDIMNFKYANSFIHALKKIKTFAFNSYFNSIVRYLNTNSEKFFFLIILTPTKFGLYALATTIGAIVRTAGTAIFLSFGPIYYQNNKDGDKFKNKKIYFLFFLVSPILFIIFLLIVKFSWPYFIDSSFNDSLELVSLISLLYVFEIYYGLSEYYYLQKKDTKFLLKYEFLFFLIYIFTFLFLYFIPNISLTKILLVLNLISIVKLFGIIVRDKKHDLYSLLLIIFINITVILFITYEFGGLA